MKIITILLLLITSCAKYTPKQAYSIHQDLIDNDCYEFVRDNNGEIKEVTLNQTDLCLMIAYPEKGDF